jgi:hypothetical protein
LPFLATSFEVSLTQDTDRRSLLSNVNTFVNI